MTLHRSCFRSLSLSLSQQLIITCIDMEEVRLLLLIPEIWGGNLGADIDHPLGHLCFFTQSLATYCRMLRQIGLCLFSSASFSVVH